MKNSIIALFLFSFLGSGLMAQTNTPPPPKPPKAEKKAMTTLTPQAVPGKADTYTRVENMPQFPGCETLAGNAQIACSKKAMIKYLREHPSLANQQSRGVAGTQIVEFTVQKDGSVADVRLIRALRDDTEYLTETRDMFLNMPKWKPGMLDGQAVNVSMSVPISFQL